MALFVFNLMPLLPLDGGHVAGALWEGLRRQVAKLRSCPTPDRSTSPRRCPLVVRRVRAAGRTSSCCSSTPTSCGRCRSDGVARPAVISEPRPTRTAPVDGRGRYGPVSIPINLGMPSAPPPVLAPRRQTRKIKVGKVDVGGDAPVSVQSMTHDADHRHQRDPAADRRADRDGLRHRPGRRARARTTPRRCRRSRRSRRSRSSPTSTSSRSTCSPRSTPAARPCASTRATSASSTTRSRRSPRPREDAGVSIRIGVNAGSLDPRLLEKYGKATAEALVESAVWEASLFEEHDFHDFKISVKHNDPVVMVRAYELLSERGDWPLHLGVTEAGPAFQGTIKSATAFGALLSKGIGDTIRVSLSAPPVEEVKVGIQILQSLNLRPAQARDRLVPLVRARAGRRLHPRRAGHRRARGHGGAAARRRHGLRRQRSGRGPRGRPRRRVRQRQGPDLRQGRGDQDRPRVEDRRDPDRGGDAHRRDDGASTPATARRSSPVADGAADRATDDRSASAGARPHGSAQRPWVRGAALPAVGLKVLGPGDVRRELPRPVRPRPGRTSFVAARRVERAAPSPGARRAGALGVVRAGRAGSVCWSGANVVPGGGDPATRCEAFAENARAHGRRCSSLVGPAAAVLGMWRLLEPDWGPARDVRADQPLMAIDHAPLVRPDPRVRRSAPTSSTWCSRRASRCSPRRSATRPWPADGGRTVAGAPARRPGARSCGSTTAAAPGRQVVFKAELGAVGRRRRAGAGRVGRPPVPRPRPRRRRDGGRRALDPPRGGAGGVACT